MRIPFLDYVRLVACLMVIFVLNVAYMLISPLLSTPVSICLIAVSTYVACFIICKVLSWIPGSRYIIG